MQVFKDAGIKESDLRNPETAMFIRMSSSIFFSFFFFLRGICLFDCCGVVIVYCFFFEPPHTHTLSLFLSVLHFPHVLIGKCAHVSSVVFSGCIGR
jgi:hypothetical protein